jgi:3-oxoadipate enol-lactonase
VAPSITHHINGLRVEDSGDPGRPALMCVRSLFLDGRMFDDLHHAVAGKYRLIRPDFRGQGSSRSPRAGVVTMKK